MFLVYSGGQITGRLNNGNIQLMDFYYSDIQMILPTIWPKTFWPEYLAVVIQNSGKIRLTDNLTNVQLWAIQKLDKFVNQITLFLCWALKLYLFQLDQLINYRQCLKTFESQTPLQMGISLVGNYKNDLVYWHIFPVFRSLNYVLLGLNNRCFWIVPDVFSLHEHHFIGILCSVM